MKLILLQDVKGHGKKGQVVDASEGYARNFLLPRKLAVEATKQNIDQLEHAKMKEEQEKIEIMDEALALAKKIGEFKVEIKVKSGDNGKLFGAVTNKEISAFLLEQYGFDIDKKKIVLAEPIKSVGEKQIDIKLHPKVTAKLTVNIVEG